MTNEIVGIISVLACTGILFLLRYLILTVGKRKRKPALTQGSKATNRSLTRAKTGLVLKERCSWET